VGTEQLGDRQPGRVARDRQPGARGPRPAARARCSNAIADFSAAYADQNERDYDVFKAAVNSGRLTARTGL